MARGKVGRPSKGDRTVMYVRVPTTIAARIKADADVRGLPLVDVAAEILSAHYGEDYAPTRIQRDQEALDLKSA